MERTFLKYRVNMKCLTKTKLNYISLNNSTSLDFIKSNLTAVLSAVVPTKIKEVKLKSLISPRLDI